MYVASRVVKSRPSLRLAGQWKLFGSTGISGKSILFSFRPGKGLTVAVSVAEVKFRTHVGFGRALKLHHTRPFGNRISVSCHWTVKDFILMQYDAAGKTETCTVAEQSDEYSGFQRLEVSIHIPGRRWKRYWLVVHPDAFHSSIGLALAPLLSVICISIAIHYLCSQI